jgi:hypothetical protein
MFSRYLHIHDHVIRIDEEIALLFIEFDLLYECNDPDYDHDLHLNPEHKWTLMEVETLLTAIAHT